MRPALCDLRSVTAWHGRTLLLIPFAVRNSGSGSDFVSVILIQKTPFSQFLVASRVSSGNKKTHPLSWCVFFGPALQVPANLLYAAYQPTASLRLIAHGCMPPCSAFGFRPISDGGGTVWIAI